MSHLGEMLTRVELGFHVVILPMFDSSEGEEELMVQAIELRTVRVATVDVTQLEAEMPHVGEPALPSGFLFFCQLLVLEQWLNDRLTVGAKVVVGERRVRGQVASYLASAKCMV